MTCLAFGAAGIIGVTTGCDAQQSPDDESPWGTPLQQQEQEKEQQQEPSRPVQPITPGE